MGDTNIKAPRNHSDAIQLYADLDALMRRYKPLVDVETVLAALTLHLSGIIFSITEPAVLVALAATTNLLHGPASKTPAGAVQ